MYNEKNFQSIINDDLGETSQKYFREIKNFKSLSKEKEHELFEKYKNEHDIKARNELITSNLKYACSIANAYRGRGLSFMELISEANKGLIDALDKFDSNNDVKFYCYAKWWIIQRVQAAVDERNKFLTTELPKEKDIQLSWDGENEATEYSYDEEETIEDFIYEESEYEDNDLKKFIGKLIKKLSKRERDMVSMYYGLNGNKPKTLDEIGEVYHVTRERARQVIKNTFRKIRTEAMLVDCKYISR